MSEGRDRLTRAQRFGRFVHLHQGARALAADDLPAQIHGPDIDFLAGAHVREFDGDQRPVDFDDLTH